MKEIKKGVWITLVAVASLLVSFYWFYGFTMFLCTIVDEFKSTVRILPPLIVGVEMVILYLALVWHLFIRRIKKTTGIILVSANGVLSLLSLILMFFELSYYFDSAAMALRPFMLISGMILNALGIFFLARLTLPKEPTVYNLPQLSVSIPSYILYSVEFFFASYYLGDFVSSFFRFGQYGENPFAYIVFLLIMAIIPFNLFFRFTKQHWKHVHLLSIIFASVDLVLAVAAFAFLFTQAYCDVTQNIFYIDFAGRYPIGPATCVVLLLVASVHLFITFFKKKKEPTAPENVTE